MVNLAGFMRYIKTYILPFYCCQPQQRGDFEARPFDSLDPKDYGIDFDDDEDDVAYGK